MVDAAAQTDDVMAAVEYVHSLPYVDGARVAVAGCSFGGIVSLFAAERGTGIEAAVDFAGGAMSWTDAPDLQVRMKQAARGARVPVLFIQAENDFDTAPSRVLSEEMRSAGSRRACASTRRTARRTKRAITSATAARTRPGGTRCCRS